MLVAHPSECLNLIIQTPLRIHLPFVVRNKVTYHSTSAGQEGRRHFTLVSSDPIEILQN